MSSDTKFANLLPLKEDIPDVDPDAPTAELKEKQSILAASSIFEYILKNAEALLHDWPSTHDKMEYNLVADCGPGTIVSNAVYKAALKETFEGQSEGEVAKTKKALETSKRAAEVYCRRFSRKSWKALLEFVNHYMPVIWWVVQPTMISNMEKGSLTSNYENEHDQIVQYFGKLLFLPAFTKIIGTDLPQTPIAATVLGNAIASRLKEALEQAKHRYADWELKNSDLIAGKRNRDDDGSDDESLVSSPERASASMIPSQLSPNNHLAKKRRSR